MESLKIDVVSWRYSLSCHVILPESPDHPNNFGKKGNPLKHLKNQQHDG